MNIEQLREDEKYLRKLKPKELAAELRSYVEHMKIDDSLESTWEMANIVRAADMLEGSAK